MASIEQTQTWEAERYAREARFVADLGMPVVDLLAPREGERILDLGCGDGALTEKLAAMGIDVLGVDAAPDLLRAARDRGLDVREMDGHALTFDSEFDAVFSNAALHWMLEPARVIAGVHRALKPGGRFVGEMGGYLNVAAAKVALVAVMERHGYDGRGAIPWFFPSPDEYRHLLEAGGFTVSSIELIPRPTPIPGHVSGWLDTFGENFFRLAPEADRENLRQEVADLLATALRDGEGNWTLDYVRLRFAAHRG